MRRGLAVLVCTLLALPAAAALYKWTDANGHVVYSDQPPPGDVKTETLKGPPPPANPNAVKDMAAKDLELKKKRADAAEKDKKAETQRADANKRAEQCQRAQLQVRQLAAEQVPITRINEKGETVYMDDATRRKERDLIEVWVRQNCM
jgi:hypothetical protein